MAFTEVRCSRCRHVGFACAATLPAMLRCSHCNSVEFFRHGQQTICAHVVDDDDAWRQYEEQPSTPRTVVDAHEEQPKLRRRAYHKQRKLVQPKRTRKRQLAPRVAETA